MSLASRSWTALWAVALLVFPTGAAFVHDHGAEEVGAHAKPAAACTVDHHGFEPLPAGPLVHAASEPHRHSCGGCWLRGQRTIEAPSAGVIAFGTAPLEHHVVAARHEASAVARSSETRRGPPAA